MRLAEMRGSQLTSCARTSAFNSLGPFIMTGRPRRRQSRQATRCSTACATRRASRPLGTCETSSTRWEGLIRLSYHCSLHQTVEGGGGGREMSISAKGNATLTNHPPFCVAAVWQLKQEVAAIKDSRLAKRRQVSDKFSVSMGDLSAQRRRSSRDGDPLGFALRSSLVAKSMDGLLEDIRKKHNGKASLATQSASDLSVGCTASS